MARKESIPVDSSAAPGSPWATMWREYAVIGIGGALGAMARSAVAAYAARRCGEAIPHGAVIGTVLVNITGCFLIGLIAAATGAEGRAPAGALWRQFLMVGILGGYTTFSSFSLQTLELARGNEWLYASLNALLSLTLCLLAVWAGHAGGTALNHWK